MERNSKNKIGSKGKTTRKILIFLLGFFIVAAVSVFFLVPAFISSETGRKTILAKINEAVGGRTNFATLSMGWLKGVQVTDVSFTDEAGLTSIKVEGITTKPHYASFLAGGMSFGKTVIDKPRVRIKQFRPVVKGEGPTPLPAGGKKSQMVALPIKRIDLIVNEGNLQVTDSAAQSVELSQISSRLALRPPGRQTRFDIELTVPEGGEVSRISAAGRVKPNRRTGWQLKGTSGELTVEVNDLDIGSLGPLLELAGIDVAAKGRIWADLKSEIKDGRVKKLAGTIKGSNLDITAEQLKGDRLRTGQLDVGIKLEADEQIIKLQNLRIQTDWLSAEAGGVIPTTFESLNKFLKADSKYSLEGDFDCDVAAAMTQMPHTFGLKEGTRITAGRLRGNVETVTQAGKRKLLGRASLAGLEGLVGSKTIVLTEPVEAKAEITSGKAGVNFDRLELSGPSARISCSGSSELLKYTAEIDLAEFQNQLGQFVDTGAYKVAGQLSGSGEVSAGKHKIMAVGSSILKDVRISSAERISAFEPRAEMDFTVAVETEKKIVGVDVVRLKGGFGQFTIEDSVVPFSKESKEDMSLAASASVDLQKLTPFAVLWAAFPKEMQLAGLAESQVSVNSKKGSYRIETDSTRIKNLRVSYPEKEPFEQEQVSLIFDGTYNPAEKNWVIRKLELISPDIKIKGDFEQKVEAGQTRLQGRADCEYDWAAVSTVWAPFLPKGLNLEGKRKDIFTFSSQYPVGQIDKLPANLNTKARLGFKKAAYMGLNFGPTDVDVQIRNGVLDVAPFSTTVNDGRFSFVGQADFKKEPALFKTAQPIQIAQGIQINDQTTRKLLMYVNPVFAEAVNVSGVANFHCEKLAIPLAGGSKNDIEVVGTISIDRLRLETSDLLGQILSVIGASTRGEQITIHPTRFALQQGFLRYDDMQMDVGDNPVNFKGVIGLDKSLNMIVTLPYTSRGTTVRTEQQIRGERITLPLKGTTDKPELDVAKLLEEQLRQQLREKAREALEELFK